MENQRDKTKAFLSEMLLDQQSLLGMLQVLDMIELHLKMVRQSLIDAFGVDNDNGETH